MKKTPLQQQSLTCLMVLGSTSCVLSSVTWAPALPADITSAISSKACPLSCNLVSLFLYSLPFKKQDLQAQKRVLTHDCTPVPQNQKSWYNSNQLIHLRSGNDWLLYNDEKVAISEEPPRQMAYMYLYRRVA